MNFVLKKCCCKGPEKKNKGEGNSHSFNVMTATVTGIQFRLSYFGLFSSRSLSVGLCISTAQVSVLWTNRTSSGRN